MDLGRAELRGVEFTGVKLREADLSRARCAEAVFAGCDLSAAVLTGADFSAASLVGSDLTGVDPAEVGLRGATIDERQAVLLAEAAGMTVVPTPS
ncbi:pentapeptide repeat-containing protein [Leifsonia shinshuensis]